MNCYRSGGQGWAAGTEEAAEGSFDPAVDGDRDGDGDDKPGGEAEQGLVLGRAGLPVEEEYADDHGVEEVEGVTSLAEGFHPGMLEDTDAGRAESEAEDDESKGRSKDGGVDDEVGDGAGPADDDSDGGEAYEDEGPGEPLEVAAAQKDDAGSHAHKELGKAHEGVELEEIDPGADGLQADVALGCEARVGEGAGESEKATGGKKRHELLAREAGHGREHEGEDEIEEGLNREAPVGHVPGEGGLRDPALEEGEAEQGGEPEVGGGPAPLRDEEVGIVRAHLEADEEVAGGGEKEGEGEGWVDAGEAGLPKGAEAGGPAGVGVDQDESGEHEEEADAAVADGAELAKGCGGQDKSVHGAHVEERDPESGEEADGGEGWKKGPLDRRGAHGE